MKITKTKKQGQMMPFTTNEERVTSLNAIEILIHQREKNSDIEFLCQEVIFDIN